MHKKISPDFLQSPVIIGGLGGSGTRVITDIISESGIQFGNYLNPALDSLHFGYVTEPYRDSVIWPYRRMKPLIDLFVALQFGQSLSLRETITLLRIAFWKSSMLKPPGGPFRHARHIWRTAHRHRINFNSGTQWGWKLPRNQLYLQALSQYFPSCKYVHVVRHGLDMAFSENRTQLTYYGRFFDIDIHDSSTPTTSKQLDYWIRSNLNAFKVCTEHMSGRFIVINYDTLCGQPAKTIGQLLHFLDIPYDDGLIRQLCTKVSPTSIRRYQSEDLGQFNEKQMLAVQKLGFEV